MRSRRFFSIFGRFLMIFGVGSKISENFSVTKNFVQRFSQ